MLEAFFIEECAGQLDHRLIDHWFLLIMFEWNLNIFIYEQTLFQNFILLLKRLVLLPCLFSELFLLFQCFTCSFELPFSILKLVILLLKLLVGSLEQLLLPV